MMAPERAPQPDLDLLGARLDLHSEAERASGEWHGSDGSRGQSDLSCKKHSSIGKWCMMAMLLRRERLAHLPMMPRWVGDSSDSPAVSFGDRCDFPGSGTDGLCEYSVRVLYGQDHADGRSVA